MDREKIARYGINVSDVEGVIGAGVGGQAATQVIQGEMLFDLVVRMKPEYRSSTHDIGNLLVPTPSGQQVPISELATIHQGNGASFIYRENNSRYIGVQFSIEGRDLARAVDEAQKAVQASVALPPGYTLDWGGEYSEYVAAKGQLEIIGPLAILLIFMILFVLYGNFKFPVTVVIGVVMTEPVGALIALKINAHAVQRQPWPGPARPARRFGRDGSHPGLLHQQTSHREPRHPVGDSPGCAAAAPPDYDDRARGLPGSITCGAIHRHWVGHAKAIRDRHRGGIDVAAAPGVLRQPGALRNGGQAGRRAPGIEE